MSSEGGVVDVFEAPMKAVTDEEAVVVEDNDVEKEVDLFGGPVNSSQIIYSFW
jgi:hypothetical protein